MANTWKTLSDGDIARRALARLHNKLKFVKTINKEYHDEFAKTGAKNGGTILIREPNQFTVRSGAVMVVQDIAESTQSFSTLTQRGVDINLSTVEHTMSVDNFEGRILDPAMDKLASEVEFIVLSGVYKDIYNYSGTPATSPASITAVRNGGVKLSQGLAPRSDRHFMTDSVGMAATADSMNAYFHKASELERAFAEGYIGEAAGFKFWESDMIPVHTNGTRDDTTPVMDTSTIANGDTTLTTTGIDNAATLTAGDVFTVAGVYAVNPETKQAYSHLQQFVVRTAKTCDSTDVIDVYPTIYISGAKQNVSVTGAGAGKALVFVAAGGSGAASAAYAQSLAYHRDAFTFATADLHLEPGQRMSRAVIDGISMRIWRGADITNDKFPCRIDVLFGYKTVRPEWACRVRG